MAKEGGRSSDRKEKPDEPAVSDTPQGHAPRSHRERQERKRHVLTHGTSSMTPSISSALVAKNSDLFFLPSLWRFQARRSALVTPHDEVVGMTK